MNKKVLVLILAVLAVVALAAIAFSGGSEDKKSEPVPCTGIVLDKTTLSVEEGSSGSLKASASPSGCTDGVVWSTSDASVCTVSGGSVRGVSPGTATVTAKCGAYTASCIVEVTKAPTVGEKNALKKAQDLYQSIIVFYSEKGMRDSLTGFYGFTESEADYAMSHLDADWQSQADKQAKRYLEQHLGPEGLVYQLTVFHDYTEEQARKAVQDLGDVDWQSEAEQRAVLLRDERSYSKAAALESLLGDGYTSEQAQKAVDKAYA